jgi:hypothetical protein
MALSLRAIKKLTDGSGLGVFLPAAGSYGMFRAGRLAAPWITGALRSAARALLENSAEKLSFPLKLPKSKSQARKCAFGLRTANKKEFTGEEVLCKLPRSCLSGQRMDRRRVRSN